MIGFGLEEVNRPEFKGEIQFSAIALGTVAASSILLTSVQDTLDSKMDKRRKGVYGPAAAGKQFYGED